MRTIDLATWPRRKHFELFNAFDYPHFGLCANVDITELYAVVQAQRLSLTTVLTYGLARTANALSEFRYRIRDGKVVEHAVVHPSVTLLVEDDLFSFCTLTYHERFAEFAAAAAATMARVKSHPTLEDEAEQDDLLYMTSIPWVSFTGLLHPIHMHPTDSVPRISWGKFFTDDGHLKLPLSVQAHHALMDGIHMARYFLQAQEWLDHPLDWLTPDAG